MRFGMLVHIYPIQVKLKVRIIGQSSRTEDETAAMVVVGTVHRENVCAAGDIWRITLNYDRNVL